MQVFRFIAQSEKWREIRNKVLTGTEVAGLFGLNRYLSISKLEKKKKGEVKDELVDNEILRAGRMGEYVAIASAREAGFNVESAAPEGQVEFVVSDNGLLGASLDGIIWDVNVGKCIAECKSTSNQQKFEKWLKADLDVHYLLQIQAQLGICHLEHGYFVGVNSLPPYATVIYKINFSHEIYKIILDKVVDFWLNIEKGNKNEVSETDKARIIELLPQTVSKVMETWLPKKEEKVDVLEMLKNL